jgi:hypothetical protein
MQRSRSIILAVGALALVGLVVGCGGGGQSGDPIAGAVTLDGQPVSSAMVTLIPDDSGAETYVVYVTDGRHSGIAAPGSYTAEVEVYTSAAGEEIPEGYEEEAGSERSAGVFGTTLTVPEGGSESLDIALTQADKLVDEDTGGGEREY